MFDGFAIFDVFLEQRGRRWLSSVRTIEGKLVMTGLRSSRSRYEAHTSLFLVLLSAPYRSQFSGREARADQPVRVRHSLPLKL